LGSKDLGKILPINGILIEDICMLKHFTKDYFELNYKIRLVGGPT